jgi:hypothetical protein
MSTITRDRKRVRRHAIRPDGRPLCGGGHGARTAQFQEDHVDDVNCVACLKIKNAPTPPQFLPAEIPPAIPNVSELPSPIPAGKPALSLSKGNQRTVK